MRQSITGFSNPRVKWARALRDKKHRRREGRFLVEGLRICCEAQDAGILPEMLWLAAGREPQPRADALAGAVLAAGGEVIETSADILAKLSGKGNPQAIVGIYADLGHALATLDRNAAPLWLVAQAMRDPGNLGTMLRTGDAVGAGGLILIDDCADPFSVEAVRASMGAIFTVPVVQARWPEFLTWLRAGPGQLVGTSLQTDHDYGSARYAAPCYILTGNEAQGLPADYAAECDLLVKIPMHGRADSLNAAVATAVMAYEVRRQIDRVDSGA